MKNVHKVCHVLRRLSVDNWGGIETAVLHTCQELISKGIKSPIFCTDTLSKSGKEIVKGVPVHRFTSFYALLGLSLKDKQQLDLKGGNPLSAGLFFALLKEPQLSFLHVHVQNRLGGIVRTVARLRRIPYIVTLHGGHFTLPETHAISMMTPSKKYWEWGKCFSWMLGTRKVLEDADGIIAVGQDEYVEVLKRYPEKKVFYLPNGIDLKAFSKGDPQLFRQAHGLKESERLILCVSRIDPQKDQLLLVKAFARFVKSHPEYRLVLIGPVSVDSYYKIIIHTIESLGIASSVTIIPGYASDNPLLYSAYHASDIFVLPSIMEPFGIVVLEAWAAGVPVIASRVGGIPGFAKDNENILLFKTGNEDILLQKLQLLASNPSLREHLINSTKREVQQYAWSKITDRLLDIYDEVLTAYNEKKR